MLPRLAVIDPELTIGLPADVTASTGMDVLTQVIEPYLSTRANPMTDAFCLDVIPRVARSLRRAWTDGRDLDARSDMALAALMGGLWLANAGLGAVHGFAAPIGGCYAAPHGAVCAALLPVVMRVNLHALRTRAHHAQAGFAARTLARFDTVARLLTGDPDAIAERGIDWLERLREDLRVPGLGAYGVQASDADELATAAARASSMRANPVALELEELKAIVVAAM